MLEKLKKLDALAELGLVRRFVDDSGLLVGYNYTDQCTYQGKWTRDTLSARGTIYNIHTGEIAARAYNKFFNFSELSKSKQRSYLRRNYFQTFDKPDGSLGIIYNYKKLSNMWRVNTRGSFGSDQAIEGAKILHEKYKTEHMDSKYTYLAEIIYPENKIIMDYGDERKLVLLTMVETATGEELPYDLMKAHAEKIGMPVVESFEFDSLEQLIQLQSELPQDREGFVVRFGDGERVKFKSLAYLKLAAAMAHMTPIHFWKQMKNGSIPEEFLSSFPEELEDEVEDIHQKLQNNYEILRWDILAEMEGIKETVCPVIVSDKKSLSKYIGQNLDKFEHPNALFCLINEHTNKLDQYIMKRIRPNRNEL